LRRFGPHPTDRLIGAPRRRAASSFMVEPVSMVMRVGLGWIQIPSATKPVQTIIKLTTITARKLEEAKSSRMTTPMPSIRQSSCRCN
jgi:hypothetical protein